MNDAPNIGYVGSNPTTSTGESMYYSDYPTKPIGGGNPYYCCVCCEISEPQINGRLEGHLNFCEYRIKKESESNG